jgi:two-component system sensor histidine kinase KdpD
MIAGVGWVVDSAMARTMVGFLLVVPVVVAGVIGGRGPSVVVAVAAGLSYSVHLPPTGSPRVDLSEDVVAIAILLAIGVLISTLVTESIESLTRRDRDRSLLLRSVSHDLRTPLAAILAAATDLLDDDLGDDDPATRRQLAAHIADDARRLDRLVANLLSLNRIESDAMRPRTQPVDLARLVRSAVEEIGGAVPIIVSTDENPTDLDADPVLLGQVMTNLLDNAVRHSPADTHVDVSIGDDGRAGVTIVVSDRGPGVPPEERELIFQPFRSGQIAGSSGVGLAICRAIVAAHGGTLSVHDREGGGAQFVVRLPRP